MKKILLFLSFIVSIVLFTSCDFSITPTEGVEYKITFISEGEAVQTELTSYISGNEYILPEIAVEGKVFEGWYVTPSFKGEKVTMIKTTDHGDKVFYAKWEGSQVIEEPLKLEDVLAELTSFTVVSDYQDTDQENYADTYYVEGNKIHAVLDNLDGSFEECYYEINDDLDYFYFTIDDTLYYVTSDNDDFYYIAISAQEVLFSLINPDLYVFDGVNKFVAADGVKAYEDLMGYEPGESDVTAATIEIYVDDDKHLSKVVVSYDASYEDFDGEPHNYSANIVYTISNFGSTTVSIPDGAIDYLESLEDKTVTVEELYDLANGTSVFFTAAIFGRVGSTYFLEDNGYYCYLIDLGAEDVFEIGDIIEVSGAVINNNNIPAVYGIEISVIDNGYVVAPSDVTSSEDVLNSKGAPINLKNVKYLGEGLLEEDGIYYFNVEFDEVEYKLVLNFEDDSDELVLLDVCESIKEALSDARNGELFDLGCVVYIFEGNENYLVVNNASTFNLVKAPEELIITDVKALPQTVTVTKGTLLESALENVNVYVYYNDGSHIMVEHNAWTYECASYEENVVGEYVVTIHYETYDMTVTVTVSEEDQSKFVLKIGDYKTITQMQDENGLSHGMPSTGNVKALIVPVTFTDYSAPSTLRSALNTVFFGTSEETGWESLSSYYEKVSYGKLKVSGTITEPVSMGLSSSSFESKYKKDENAIDTYLENIVKQLSTIYNLAEYDSDGDGIIDAMYFIYTAPVNYTDDSSCYWAFTYYLANADTYDNVKPNYYFWAGMDFFSETPASGATLTYNAETFIHETGHMLGLDDYYDFTAGSNGGSGGGTMMDYNVGDFDAYSKLILGWIEPYVVTGSTTIDLKKFNVEGNSIIIPKKWNNTIYSEYFIIEYFTPDGVNAMEAGNSGLPNIPCVLIYHIDATLANSSQMEDAWSITKYNNSSSSAHKLIVLVEADNNNSISKGKLAATSDFFKGNSTFNFGKWYNKQSAGVTVKFGTLEDTVKVTITY